MAVTIDPDVDGLLNSATDEALELDETKDAVETPCKLITGIAGSGKSFLVRKQAEEDPKSILLTASTGIASVNLNTTTLHSALGLYPDAIDDQFTSGYIRQRMHQVARQYHALGIDEASMLRSNLLDMLYTTAEQVNEYADVKEPFGITLIADMCQLPPIKEKWETKLPWIFDAECWPKFEANTVRLTKNWRQSTGLFLDALNLLRSGNGRQGAEVLRQSGAHFDRSLDPTFDGTVILGVNAAVDNYNKTRYWKLPGVAKTFHSTRWGKESGGWRNIPDSLSLKDNTFVMLLANDTERDEDGQPMFRWTNGDCGHVRGFRYGRVQVELVRNGSVVEIDLIERRTQQKSAPDEFTDDEIKEAKTGKRLPDGTFYDPKRGMWVRGAIEYMPLRLAYATTVHKSQSLTLDRIMVDMRHNFLSAPAMVYVAMSRCRTADGLHIVGDAKLIERRTNIDEAVRRWL